MNDLLDMRQLMILCEVEETPSVKEDKIEQYMQSECGVFAVAASIIWPGGYVYIISENASKWSSTGFDVSHAYYVTTTGHAVDVKGFRSPQTMAADFNYEQESYTIRGPYLPQEFMKSFMSNSNHRKPLYGNQKDIKEAVAFIKSHLAFYSDPHNSSIASSGV